MVKIDLITGFLGAGKTTFIKKYATELMRRGLNIGILENDHGAVNVDMMLLQDLEGDRCELEMVAGACCQDCYHRRFKTKLIAMGMLGYDRILVEPSGIFDADEFFDILHEEPLDSWYEIGSVIAIVDGKLEESLSTESDYLLASQISGAGCVVLSRAQEACEDELLKTVAHLNKALASVSCKRVIGDEVLCKNWDDFTQDDFDLVMQAGFKQESYVKNLFIEDSSFETLYYMHAKIPADEIFNKVETLFSADDFGNILRIKGFFEGADGWYELNAKPGKVDLNPIKRGQQVFIVIGEHLKKDKLSDFFGVKEAAWNEEDDD